MATCAWPILAEVTHCNWNNAVISYLSIDKKLDIIIAWSKLGIHANKAREDSKLGHKLHWQL